VDAEKYNLQTSNNNNKEKCNVKNKTNRSNLQSNFKEEGQEERLNLRSSSNGIME
jgi:hypothetical protein